MIPASLSTGCAPRRWLTSTPAPNGDAIASTFGSFDAFKEQFSKAAATRFGSGWAWLSVGNGGLVVESSPNQDSPIMAGGTPILGIDVWEHAYYLKYQNRRPEYVGAWWSVVNWERAEALIPVGGVRIEDTVHVTDGDPELLTGAITKSMRPNSTER